MPEQTAQTNTPTIVWDEIDGVRVAMHSRENPSSADWTIALEWTREQLRKPVRPVRYLVMSLGGGPTASQRAAFNTLIKGEKTLSAIVTSSSLVRGIVTAMSWLDSSVQAFPESKFEAALRYLQIPATDYGKFQKCVASLPERLSSTHHVR